MPKLNSLDIDLALKHFSEPSRYPMPDYLKICWERWSFVDDQIRQGRTRKQIVNLLYEKYQLSPAQSYRAVADAKTFFASTSLSHKIYDKDMALEKLLSLARSAENKGDYKSSILAYKTYLSHIIDDPQTEKEFEEILESIKSKGFTFIISTENGKKTIDISKIDATDVEYRELDKEIQQLPSISDWNLDNIVQDMKASEDKSLDV